MVSLVALIRPARLAGRRPIQCRRPGRGKLCISDANGLFLERIMTQPTPSPLHPAIGQHPPSVLGLGLAALGRPGYINLGHVKDTASGRSIEAMRKRALSWPGIESRCDASSGRPRSALSTQGQIGAHDGPRPSVSSRSRWKNLERVGLDALPSEARTCRCPHYLRTNAANPCPPLERRSCAERGTRQTPGQGRLAALTGPEQGQGGCSRESALQRLLGEARDVSMHFDHGLF